MSCLLALELWTLSPRPIKRLTWAEFKISSGADLVFRFFLKLTAQPSITHPQSLNHPVSYNDTAIDNGATSPRLSALHNSQIPCASPGALNSHRTPNPHLPDPLLFHNSRSSPTRNLLPTTPRWHYQWLHGTDLLHWYHTYLYPRPHYRIPQHWRACQMRADRDL